MDELALAEDFQFDAQGFLMLRNVFDAERCRHYLEELERLFARKYDDPWLRDGVRGQTTVQFTEGQRRINGLPLWTEVFDEVISFAPVVERLRHIDATYNPAMRELLAGNQGNINHYVFPPKVRSRFDATQRELTEWMEWQRTAPASSG